MAFTGFCLPVAVTIFCLLSVTSGFYQRSVAAGRGPGIVHGAHQNPHQRASVQMTGDEPLAIDDVLRMGNEAHGSPTRRTYRDGREVIEDAYDMVLSPEQYRRLYQGGMSRNGGRTVATPWTGAIIPYTINPTDFDQEEVGKIKKGMETWQNLTCVQFRPKTDADENWAYINRGDGQSCTATLGMEGGKQTVNLGHGCFTKSTIEHEFGHTIGLIHEQQRPQRDGYVRVNYYAIKPDQVGWLAKYAQDSDDKMGLDYDYGSVMHYSKTAFTENGRQTIYTRDPKQENVIGRAYGPSFLDAKLVNLMYKCQDRCPNQRQCGDDCFLTEDCRCFCKKDMPKEPCENKRSNCETLAKSGQCTKSKDYMLRYCKPACNACDGDSGATTNEVADEPCTNVRGDKDCDLWASEGECERIPNFMLPNCKKACGECGGSTGPVPQGQCRDNNKHCPRLALSGDCTSNPGYMNQYCNKSCGRCEDDCVDLNADCPLMAQSDNCVRRPDLFQTCKKSCNMCGLGPCQDRNPDCERMAANGECNRNPEMMLKECHVSCNFCPKDLGQDPTAEPGCVDYDLVCQYLADKGMCSELKNTMGRECAQHCGTCNQEFKVPGNCVDEDVHCWIWAVSGHCKTGLKHICPRTCDICPKCEDRLTYCDELARQGDCQSNRQYMTNTCPQTCNFC